MDQNKEHKDQKDPKDKGRERGARVSNWGASISANQPNQPANENQQNSSTVSMTMTCALEWCVVVYVPLIASCQ